MKTLKKIAAVLAMILTLMACKNSNSNKQTTSSEEGNSSGIELPEDRLGGFLPKAPFGNSTVDFQDDSVTIIENEGYSGFPKMMITYGNNFPVMEGVPNEFLHEVATTFQQMFPQDSTLNLEKQHAVVNAMHQYNSAIPVFKGRYESIAENISEEVEKLSQAYSVCDIIMYRDGTGRQTMEVVEHILHAVTGAGLHIVMPEKWSFTDSESEVTRIMDKAVEAGLYDIAGYGDILEESKEVYQRVLVQEFAYWLISTYWNLQEPYGPMEEEEWNIDNKEQLLEKLPEGYDLVRNTIDDIMKAPSMEVLEAFRKYN
ncbi:hypothetical protein [Ulvibacterium sp.]|uniref:hypothetical protein n=1 Tax=Ulvibacterium sp. TaxID=2665914 RepID=UPI002620D075|nr:hypothetical protein [Ulvibacterium sp.]